MPGILCEHCTAACCRYIALPMDTPETDADFEDIRWFLIHERVSVFVEDGDWYIAFDTPCRHLQADHRCGIYATRPKVCQTYSTEECDYHSGDYGWEQHFTSPEHLEEYLRTHPPASKRRKAPARSRRPRSLAHAIGRQRKDALPPIAPQLDRRGIALPVLPIQR